MSSGQLIPNSVGRLDPVVEAIAEGKHLIAYRLLEDRIKQVIEKHNAEAARQLRSAEELSELIAFRGKLAADASFRADLTAALKAPESIRTRILWAKDVALEIQAYNTGMSPEELEKLGPGI